MSTIKRTTTENVTTLKGFTLIELMITVAIVGILAAIAYPAYTDSVTKSRRTDAQGALMSFAQAAERQYTIDGTYAKMDKDKSDADETSSVIPHASIFPSEAPLDGSTKYYNLTIEKASSSYYELRATPKGAQAGDGYLQITSTGSKKWNKGGKGTLVDW